MSVATKKAKTDAVKLLAEWGDVSAQIAVFDRERESQLAPHGERYQKKIAPINAKFYSSTRELRARRDAVQKQLEELLLAQVDAEGMPLMPQLHGQQATATVHTTPRRAMDAQKYFEAVPVSERGAGFWAGVSVLVGTAEKFLGKLKLDAIATVKRSYRVELRLK